MLRTDEFFDKSLANFPRQSFDTIVTLRSEDGDGSEDVAEIVNSRSFILNSRPLALSNVGKPS